MCCDIYSSLVVGAQNCTLDLLQDLKLFAESFRGRFDGSHDSGVSGGNCCVQSPLLSPRSRGMVEVRTQEREEKQRRTELCGRKKEVG